MSANCAIIRIPGPSRKIEAPLLSEIEESFHMIAEEKQKKPIVLSLVRPYSKDFVQSSEHLPKCMQSIFNSAHLENAYTDLLTLAESHLHEEVKLAMVNHLKMMAPNHFK